MKSKAIPLLTILLFGVLVAVGCGGGGGGGNGGGGSGTPNPFNGRWDGTWTQASPANNGTVLLAIAGNGAVSGDVFDATLNEEGTLSGVINDAGAMSFQVVFPAQTQTWTGNASINGSNHLVGTWTVTGPGLNTTRTFDTVEF
jgi:hypothetical protein